MTPAVVVAAELAALGVDLGVDDVGRLLLIRPVGLDRIPAGLRAAVQEHSGELRGMVLASVSAAVPAAEEVER